MCTNCNNYVKGICESEDTFDFYYNPPAYCEKCGNPYPWTAKIIENAVEIISLDEHLPDEIKQIIKDAIPDLIVDSVMAPVATVKYRKFTQSAADYTQDGLKNLLIDVVSETVKNSSWG